MLSTVSPDFAAANAAIYSHNAEVSGKKKRKPDVAGERQATVADSDDEEEDDGDSSDGSCINKGYEEMNVVGGRQAHDDDDW